MPHRKVLLHVVCIIALGIIIYANSLDGQFIWDDVHLIKNNTHIKDWRYLPDLFKEDIGAGSAHPYNFYRPFLMSTLMLDYSLWGLDVRGYHLTTILIHIMAGLAIYWFVSILFHSDIVSLFASLLFISHPIHTEDVAYITGRADSLVFFFILISLIFYVRYVRLGSFLASIISLLGYCLAVLSKGHGLILPVLIIFYHYFERIKIKKLYLSIMFFLTAVYLILRASMFGSSFSYHIYLSHFWERVPGFFVALAGYVRLLLVPVNLHAEYGDGTEIFMMADIQAKIGLAVAFLLIAVLLWKKEDRDILFFSIAWFLITLLPSSNLFYPASAYMAERYLYIPSLGFFLIIGHTASVMLNRHKRRTIFIFSSVIILYSALTMAQNIYWKTPIEFYSRTLKYSPDSARIMNDLGYAYYNAGKDKEAVYYFRKAIGADPNYTNAYDNLGLMYLANGNNDKALALFKKVIELAPQNSNTYNNIGSVYYARGDSEKAIYYFNKSLQIFPGQSSAYYNLGNVYKERGEYAKSVSMYKNAIEADSDFAKAYNNLGILYIDLGRPEDAFLMFKKALTIRPTYGMAHANLSTMYFSRKEYALALKHCDTALGLGHQVAPSYLKALRPYRNSRK